MNNVILIIFSILLPVAGMSQPDFHHKIVSAFANTEDVQEFISAYSIDTFTTHEVKDYRPYQKFNAVDSALFYAPLKGIVGPFETNGVLTWYKVIQIDSAMRMRAGNVFIDPGVTSELKAQQLSKEILYVAQKGKSFDELCKKYKNDSNSNYECDLGWFFEGMMVKEFENELLRHPKGAVFIVKTQFGWHVVKVLDNHVKDRYKVTAVPLFLQKP
jgi:hypothetical protein